jgi:hypothetical protein
MALRAVLARELSAVRNGAPNALRARGAIKIGRSTRLPRHPPSGYPLASQGVRHARDRPKASRKPRRVRQAHLQNAGQMEILVMNGSSRSIWLMASVVVITGAHARRGDGLATRQLKEPGDDGA